MRTYRLKSPQEGELSTAVTAAGRMQPATPRPHRRGALVLGALTQLTDWSREAAAARGRRRGGGGRKNRTLQAKGGGPASDCLLQTSRGQTEGKTEEVCTSNRGRVSQRLRVRASRVADDDVAGVPQNSVSKVVCINEEDTKPPSEKILIEFGSSALGGTGARHGRGMTLSQYPSRCVYSHKQEDVPLLRWGWGTARSVRAGRRGTDP